VVSHTHHEGDTSTRRNPTSMVHVHRKIGDSRDARVATRPVGGCPSVANLPRPPIHGRSFGRFDGITDLVEEASALTLARRRRVRRASPTRLPNLTPLRPSRRAFLLRSRTGRYFHIAAFAKVLLPPVANPPHPLNRRINAPAELSPRSIRIAPWTYNPLWGYPSFPCQKCP
jgi:hypothetical protein